MRGQQVVTTLRRGARTIHLTETKAQIGSHIRCVTFCDIILRRAFVISAGEAREDGYVDCQRCIEAATKEEAV